MQPDYYGILGLSRSASLQEIKQAAHTKSTGIKTALAVLSDTGQRNTYDAKLSPGQPNHYTTLAVSQMANTAQIKAAARARMNEIKEAYENLSQPEIRAAYDSLLPPEKPPVPRSLPLPPQPKQEEVIIQPNSVPLQDRHESQVFPYQPPTVSSTNTVIKATEMELAGRGTRLRAYIIDGSILMAPFIIFGMLITMVVPDWRVAFTLLRGATLLGFIGVVITNVILLYRYGQTLGKRLLSIKIVTTEGHRAELLRILLRQVLATSLLMAILLSAILGVGTLFFFLDPLLIFQKSRRCLHDLISNTTVVKVLPGHNDTPSLLLGAIAISAKIIFFLFLAVIVIPAYIDYLKRGKVSEAIQILNDTKPHVEKYMAANGRFPAIDLMLTEPSIKYTARLKSNPEEFYLEATMNNEDSILAGKVVRLTFEFHSKTWTCSAPEPKGIPQRYLPSNCKR